VAEYGLDFAMSSPRMLIFERSRTGPAMQVPGGRLDDPKAAGNVDLPHRP
jgi:hypothetical protein